jgi:shikimate kinase
MVFDVKMDNLARKAHFVAGGHTTKTPASITYSSVVSRDSVGIAFLLAALNCLDVCVADVGNAYLKADCCEKIWTVAGPEFGSDAGAVMIVKKALYGLKSSGAAWRALFASTLKLTWDSKDHMQIRMYGHDHQLLMALVTTR